MNTKQYTVTDGSNFHLTDINTDFTDGKSKGPEIETATLSNIKDLERLQEVLYAYNKYGILIVLQAMDAAGKDSTIKLHHVRS